MAASAQLVQTSEPVLSPVTPGTQAESWYALRTRSRHEKIVVQRLEERAVTTFLPVVTEVHRWSDRKKSVQVPLFSGYVFAKICAQPAGATAHAAGRRRRQFGRGRR